MGWDTTTADSVRLTMISSVTGVATPWATMFAQDYQGTWLANGSFDMNIEEPQDTWAIYRVRGPGRADTVGAIPGPVWRLNASADLARIALLTRDYRGTVWMFRVVHR